MTKRRTPPEALYSPRVGELVRDRRSGRVGEYQATIGEEVWVRPPGGGYEWTAFRSEIEPASRSTVSGGPRRQPKGRAA